MKNQNIQAKKSRMKKILIPLAILIPVMAALVVASLVIEREPMNAKEILDKQEWSEKELTRTLSRSMQLQTDRDFRREVTRHLNTQIYKLPPEKQSEIRVAAVADAMNKSLQQLRVLKPVERERLMRRMHEQVDRHYDRVRNMSTEQRRLEREKNASAETKAIANEANKIIIIQMTPEERRDFNPIIEKWLKTMREL
jgi:microcompartment protein CcmL/EutN